MPLSESERVMEDDTQGPLTSPPGDVMGDLALAAAFRISRKSAYRWATKGLKVLVLDDEIGPDDGKKGKNKLLYDPEDPDDVERFAIALSLMDDEDAAAAEESLEEPEHIHHDSDTEATDKGRFSDEVASCSRCCMFPKFPRHRRVGNFKLVQPWENCSADLPTCDHFLAVSYCWSTFHDTQRHYRIRDCTSTHGVYGSEYLPADRRIPPDEVLDRAVELASAMGLRCIWIDQACLPQDQSDEHQIGVQAMDLVYQRAAWSLGILDSIADSPGQLLALRVIQDWGEEARKWTRWPDSIWWSGFFKQLVSTSPWAIDVEGVQVEESVDLETTLGVWSKHILDFLEFLGNDRWYTRAWTFQESLSSGEHISVILRVRANLEFPPSTSKHPSVWQVFPVIDPRDKILSFTYMALQRLIFDARFFAVEQKQDHRRSERKSPIVAQQSEKHGNDCIQWSTTDPEQTRRILSRVQALHPPRGDKIYKITNPGRSNFGARMTLSSAAAASFLRTRQCLCPEDRIAIVANLCNYEIRLDTFQLATRIKSLRTCLFALSLSNGDFSLLTPDYYNLRQLPEPTSNQPSFLSHVYEGLHTIRAFSMDNYSLGSLRIVNLQKYVPNFGIIPGMMWSVNRTVDLTPIQRKWADEWWGDLNDAIEAKVEDEIRDRIHEHLSKPGNAERIRKKIRTQCEAQGRNTVFLEDDDEGDFFRGVPLRLSVTVGALRVKQRVSWMIFDILQYLHCIGESGLSDSIWQSWKIPLVSWEDSVLPDKACPALFAHPRVMSEPWSTLHFRVDGNGDYSQQWLLDRIMLHGRIWVGQYRLANMIGSGYESLLPNVFLSNDLTRPTRKCDGNSAGRNIHSWFLEPLQKSFNERFPLQRSILSWASKTMSHGESTVFERQILKQVIANGIQITSSNPTSESPTREEALMGSFAGTIAHMLYMDRYVGWKFEDQEARWANSVAAFDVDGPCEIMIPYDADRERIPHPETRDMRVCWVVEDVSDGISEMPSDEPPQYRVLERVKGVWEIMEPAPFQCYPTI
ncbi:hypothetical protein GQX73_g2434 [Xylaria multiplex]|uniref:Heterokaryon incompatibility domain-containing protein n=1 Tax=Xylaria multiplex TaxID=323545 RepID=A0A7C8MQH4_9PEZI|nr:hypothetical protein GQX73_g2434 [Xylaria multiplex]